MAEEAELRPGQPVGPALRVVGTALLARVGLDEAKTEAEAIHGFRRAMKRWRSFLRLVEPFAGDSTLPMRHDARDLARALAGARDAQAALDALADISEDYATLGPRSLATVKERLEALRANAEETTLTPEIRDRLQEFQTASANRMAQWTLEAVTFHDVAASLATGYRRALKAAPADWTAADAEALHEFRQRVVVHHTMRGSRI